VFTPEVKYGSVPIIIGANLVVKGLENALKEMKIGDKKKITVKPEDAFGERKTEFIKLVPIAEFKKQGMTPYPGMLVNINRLRGRVLSVSGGRVRVDFNHPLAGKELECDVEIKEQINDSVEKVKAVMENYLKDVKDVEISIQNEIVEIKIKNEDAPRMIKKTVSDTIIKWIEGIKKIQFIEEFAQ